MRTQKNVAINDVNKIRRSKMSTRDKSSLTQDWTSSITSFVFQLKTHVTLHPLSIISLLHGSCMTPAAKDASLDSHTNNLCSQYNYPKCIFCSKHRSGTMIICSKWGLLRHGICFKSLPKYPNKCSKCIRLFTPLLSCEENGYQNYLPILNHFYYCTNLAVEHSLFK